VLRVVGDTVEHELVIHLADVRQHETDLRAAPHLDPVGHEKHPGVLGLLHRYFDGARRLLRIARRSSREGDVRVPFGPGAAIAGRAVAVDAARMPATTNLHTSKTRSF
jgi:hypothetical protein